ncbi:hypothetical protein CEXT_103261 [Caerostris extrusa]|uniref:Uncharacterized protein n=1 Tax=Caerostris extrusa TaxID=172846 RepID=A0AAV4X6W8_CAEEX|nr:hypothetical protein CEXT_103261 [Caerostris extrusa]
MTDRLMNRLRKESFLRVPRTQCTHKNGHYMCRQTLRLINGKEGLVLGNFRSPSLLKGRLPIFKGTGDINKENVCTLFKDNVWPQVCTKYGLITGENISPPAKSCNQTIHNGVVPELPCMGISGAIVQHV